MQSLRWVNGITVQAPRLCACGHWHITHLSAPRPTVVAVGRRVRKERKA